MDDSNENKEEGFGAIFYLMLGLGFTGLFGFLAVAMGAMGGA